MKSFENALLEANNTFNCWHRRMPVGMTLIQRVARYRVGYHKRIEHVALRKRGLPTLAHTIFSS